jgi:hypothetical protein
MIEKMGMERPPIGYFTRARIHHTKRLKPRLKDHELPDTLPELGDPSFSCNTTCWMLSNNQSIQISVKNCNHFVYTTDYLFVKPTCTIIILNTSTQKNTPNIHEAQICHIIQILDMEEYFSV